MCPVANYFSFSQAVIVNFSHVLFQRYFTYIQANVNMNFHFLHNGSFILFFTLLCLFLNLHYEEFGIYTEVD